MSSSSSLIPGQPVPMYACPGGVDPSYYQGGELGQVSGSGGVRTFNGKAVLSTEAGLQISGFNVPFSTHLRYDNQAGGNSWGFGSNWVPSNGLAGLTFDGGTVLYHAGPNSTKVFFPLGGGAYEAAYFVLDRLVYDSGSDQYTLTHPDGSVKVFDGSGQLVSFQNAGGVTGTVNYSGSNYTITTTDGVSTWSLAYTVSGSLVSSVVQSVNGTPVRKADYGYDSGNLKTIKVYAWTGSAWSTGTVAAQKFSYHSGSGLLRHVITPLNYRQMVANGINPDTANNTVLSTYAETAYEYDGSNRVSVMRTHGNTYTYTFAYTAQTVVKI